MEHKASSFPLEWPTSESRTQAHKRVRAQFHTKHTQDGQLTIAMAARRLERQIEMMGGLHPVLSTNVALRLDGRPRSDENPRDPGAALYFEFKGRATVFACDKYNTVAGNIAAIAGHVDALRRVERYGVGSLEQALQGYKALPADTAANWRAVFGFRTDEIVTETMLDKAHREASKLHHPDREGGSEDRQSHINRAREFARKEILP